MAEEKERERERERERDENNLFPPLSRAWPPLVPRHRNLYVKV